MHPEDERGRFVACSYCVQRKWPEDHHPPGGVLHATNRGSNAEDDIACKTADPPQVTLLDGPASLNEAALVGQLARRLLAVAAAR